MTFILTPHGKRCAAFSYKKVLDKEYEYVYNNSWKDQVISIIRKEKENSCMCTYTESFSYNSLGKPTMYRGKTVSWTRINDYIISIIAVKI